MLTRFKNGKGVLLSLPIFCCGLILATYALTAKYLPPKIIYIENDKTIQLQASIIDRMQTIPSSPQGLCDLSVINSYQVFSIANTGSMLPTLNENSKVLVAEQPVSVGDIICFPNGDDWWVHRIIGETQDYWLCQGDALKYTDQTEFVPKDSEILRVVAILY